MKLKKMGQKQSLKVIKDSKNYTGMRRLANHNRGHLYIEVLKVQQIACLILVNVRQRKRVKCLCKTKLQLFWQKKKTLKNIISGLWRKYKNKNIHFPNVYESF